MLNESDKVISDEMYVEQLLDELDRPAPPLDLLSEARNLVRGARNDSYGPPKQDFERVAQIWSAILDTEVTYDQAILCMIGLKLSRHAFKPRRDDLLDIAGYALCLDEAERCPTNQEPDRP